MVAIVPRKNSSERTNEEQNVNSSPGNDNFVPYWLHNKYQSEIL